MDTLFSRPSIDSNSGVNSILYNSKTIQIVDEVLEKRQNAWVLDTGTVCNENVNFFAQRAKKLFISDMPKYLDRVLYDGIKLNSVWRHMDYAPDSFDVISLWNLVDYLSDNDSKRLSEICHILIKHNGFLIVTGFEEQPSENQVNSFVIGEDNRVSLRLQPQLNLPWHYRHNRALISILKPFSIVKSFRYRKGIREYLFQHS